MDEDSSYLVNDLLVEPRVVEIRKCSNRALWGPRKRLSWGQKKNSFIKKPSLPCPSAVLNTSDIPPHQMFFGVCRVSKATLTRWLSGAAHICMRQGSETTWIIKDSRQRQLLQHRWNRETSPWLCEGKMEMVIQLLQHRWNRDTSAWLCEGKMKMVIRIQYI